MTAGVLEKPHLNRRDGVVDQADPGNPGHWVVQLYTPTGMRDGDLISIDQYYLHVISSPRSRAAHKPMEIMVRPDACFGCRGRGHGGHTEGVGHAQGVRFLLWKHHETQTWKS
jgi:hypothetical protein